MDGTILYLLRLAATMLCSQDWSDHFVSEWASRTCLISSRVDLDAGSRKKGRPPDLTAAAQVEDGEVVDERSMVVQYIISLLARSSKI